MTIGKWLRVHGSIHGDVTRVFVQALDTKGLTKPTAPAMRIPMKCRAYLPLLFIVTRLATVASSTLNAFPPNFAVFMACDWALRIRHATPLEKIIFFENKTDRCTIINNKQ